ncbi:hypothetical protein GCM10027594_20390 [Hymenobacter agri]
MKISALVALWVVFQGVSCNAQQHLKTKRIPDGKWICVQDPLSSIVVKGEQVTDYYRNKLTGTTRYIFTKHACDESYETSVKNPVYLIWHEGMCYEIIGITEKYIELVYTSTGTTVTYSRKK